MSDDTTHPYPEREYPPVSPEYREALKIAARRKEIVLAEQRAYIRKIERERCETAEQEAVA